MSIIQAEKSQKNRPADRKLVSKAVAPSGRTGRPGKQTPINLAIEPSTLQRLNMARALLQLSRSVHQFQKPDDRRREFLAGLCRLARADRGLLSLTGIDRATARHQVYLNVGVDLTGKAVLPPTSSPMMAQSAPSPDGSAAPVAEGPCLDSYLSLSGISRVGRITLLRALGGKKFTPADRAIVEMAHVEFGWVYADED